MCNSHYVSHFAAFFIVVGAKTSVAESVLRYFIFPSELISPSEYNEFTIKMLVSHHTSRKWTIKVGLTNKGSPKVV